MRPDKKKTSELKTRWLCGALGGALVGLAAGTFPGNPEILGPIGCATGAVLVGTVAAVSHSFWESLRAAWELVRIALGRW